jgi:hypothetical protein
MNKQVNRLVFDTVKTHLMAQKRRAMSTRGDLCAYRAPNGDRCAVGCLISDNNYDPAIEGASAGDEMVMRCLDDEYKDADQMLLVRLQDVHDNVEPFEWTVCLSALESNLYAEGIL